MEYQHRQYQSDSVEKAVQFFSTAERNRPMMVLPTGSGKSLIIAYIVKQLRGKVLVLQPSLELLEQNYLKYSHVIEEHPDLVPATIYSASAGVKEVSRVTFAMIGSIYKKPELFEDVSYVIIDECHEVPPSRTSMYMKFLSVLPAQVVGLTATPFRLKTYSDPWVRNKKFSKINLLNREKPSFFNKFLHITQIKEMYDLGFLCPINYIEMRWDNTGLVLNSTGAEYSDKSLKEVIDRNKIIERIPGIIEQGFKKNRTSCLVFVRSVEEARHLASITPFSNYVHAETDKDERAKMIKGFKSGNIKTIFNVGILTRGFDYPGLDTVILARPTKSLTLYMQMLGRGIRNAPGKTNLALVDMCGNVERFGKIEEFIIEDDPKYGWVLRNGKQIISGRRLDELV